MGVKLYCRAMKGKTRVLLFFFYGKTITMYVNLSMLTKFG